MTKITDEQIEEIYIELRGTETAARIAEMFQVSKQFLRTVNRGEVRRQTGMSYPIRHRPKVQMPEVEWPLAEEQNIFFNPKHGAQR
jgi:hypothetical protein